MLKSYLNKIFEIAIRGDAREESYYASLAGLLSDFAESTNKKNVSITTLPKKTEAGNPDFRVWDGTQHIVGYIEAKAPAVSNLDQIEDSEQLLRYQNTFPNLILTNFFEFRLYRNGDLIDKAAIARPFIVHKLQTVPPAEKQAEFIKLLETFFAFSLPKVLDAKTLAVELAKRTRFLRDEVIAEELKAEEGIGRGHILGFYEAFKQYLIGRLSKADFADLYSQTITYGLFAARTRSENSFNRKLAYDSIPHTIGILRDIFKFISFEDLPLQMEWIIDDISEVLAITDVKNILHKYFHEGRGRDPIVHFYETFLSIYDPETREKRGVYYTPEPVVSYIVDSLHHILIKHFNRMDGFASESVTVLDPAGGTLTFLAETTKHAVQEFVSKYGEGAKDLFIREHVLQNFYAFELMMAPYAVGHLKMSFLLEELEYRLQRDERFKLYLTNTLEMEELAQTELPGMVSLSEESHLAGKVKKMQPILVILGNPPYSGHSANKGKWIDESLKKGYTLENGLKDNGYYQVDGKPLGEKNPKWLQDDYVKFIRFAQWKIDQAGEGVLGFITNHSYLDNPTFRGMRQSLMQSFNEIYILDLHGNTLKKEKCPDGSKDENVFDIMQGVAIAIFIKKKEKEAEEKKATKACKVYHSELWGLRDGKYNWLLKHDIKNTKWRKLSPKSEFYFLIPRDERNLKLYEKSPKVNEIFPVNSVGIVTARDSFVIDTDQKRLKRRIRMLCDESMPDELIRETFKLKDKPNWQLKAAREQVRNDENQEKSIQKILYRPFDVQWIFYNDALIERSRKEVMHHMKHENLGLITRRQMLPGRPCNYVFLSNLIISDGIIRSDNKGTESLFPLYLYSDNNNPSNQIQGLNKTMMMVFEPKEAYQKKKPNISKSILEKLSETYEKKPTPEQIFYYIYAVLYSNTYRSKYAEFLKIDFPRVPFTKDRELFLSLGKLGKQLVNLHLLKSKELEPPRAKFQGKGPNKVEKLQYSESEKRVLISPNQFFENIDNHIWGYQIGGYQVCHKWLKDRKGQTLSLEDTKHYCKIVTALEKTMAIQKEIDDIYPEVEKDIIVLNPK